VTSTYILIFVFTVFSEAWLRSSLEVLSAKNKLLLYSVWFAENTPADPYLVVDGKGMNGVYEGGLIILG